MITGFSGTRNGVPQEFFLETIELSGFVITKVVHGGARGVDKQADEWAIINNIPREIYHVTPTDWNKYGRNSGPMRNAKMVDVIEQCILIPDKDSYSTWDLLIKCEKKGIPVFVRNFE